MHARNLNILDTKPLNDPFDYSDENKRTEADDENQPSASRTARFASYIAIGALCFTALGVSVGYKHWLRISDKAKQALGEIEVMQRQLDAKAESSDLANAIRAFESSTQTNADTLNSALQQLNTIKEETVYAASTVNEQIQDLTALQEGPPQIRTRMTRAEARLAEIQFLLESADNRLVFFYDTAGAMALLKAADMMLIRIGSSDLLPVRERLKKDIAKLEQYELPDTKKLLAKVSNMEKNLPQLATLATDAETTEVVDIFKTEDGDNSFSGKFKNYVNNSISITKDTESPKETLNLANKQRIDQLLKLRLTALRLNILERQDSEYHYQINQINRMLDKYYLKGQRDQWQQALSEMKELTLNPEAPTIDSALQFIKNGLNKDNDQ